MPTPTIAQERGSTTPLLKATRINSQPAKAVPVSHAFDVFDLMEEPEGRIEVQRGDLTAAEVDAMALELGAEHE